MLMLCSNGLTSRPLLDAAARCLGRGQTAALVVTADDRYKADNYHVPHCQAALEALGASLTAEVRDDTVYLRLTREEAGL